MNGDNEKRISENEVTADEKEEAKILSQNNENNNIENAKSIARIIYDTSSDSKTVSRAKSLLYLIEVKNALNNDLNK